MTSILAANALTTYERAKERLNATGSQIVDGTDQASVEALVNAVSTAAENYCARRFAYVAGDVMRDRVPDGGLLLLERAPVHSIASIVIDGSTVSASDYEIEDADRGRVWSDGGWGGLAYEEPAGIIETVPGSGRLALVATYTAGYVTPPQAAASPTGGATLSTRTGSGAGTVTGTAGADATGTLETYASPDGDTYEIGARWNGGSYAVVLGAEVGDSIDLASLDVALSGLTWTFTTAALVAGLNESWTIVPSVAAPTRTLPWDLEEAVLDSVAACWRVRNAGNAQDASSERNSAIGRGVGGLLTDRAMDVLAAYRRLT